MTLLFAVNLLEPATACRQVEQLAAALGARLLVLHVQSPASGSPYAVVDPMTGLGDLASYTLFDPDVQKSMDAAEEQAFQEFLQRSFDRPVEASIRKGVPASTVLDDAAQHDVDLIVVGKRHHSPLEKFLMGDTASKIVEHSDRPVLLIPIVEAD